MSTALVATAGVSAAGAQVASGSLRGHVVDAVTSTGLARVMVIDEKGGEAVVTSADGSFEITLPAGLRRLAFSVIGYGLLRRDIQIVASSVTSLTIRLRGGAAAYNETLTVAADRFARVDPAVPAQQVLDSSDIQNLRGVLADDPLRAVQVLPGVSAGDDLRSEFSVRGQDFAHMDLVIEGFATPFLLHTVRGIEDRANTGSVAMINSDVLAEVALQNGAYVERSGNRTGASVDFRLREGSRDRPRLRIAVSGTNASAVAEGPLAAGRGSWLLSGRQSYLNLLVNRLTDEGLAFNFSDVQGKVVFDPARRQQIEATVIAGRSRLDVRDEEVSASDVFAGRNKAALGVVRWKTTGPRGWVSAGILAGINEFRNTTVDSIDLDRGQERQLAGRVDGAFQPGRSIELEAGALADRTRDTRQRQRFVNGTLRLVNDYAGAATRTGAYALMRWHPSSVLTIAPGGRIDYWTLTRDTTESPWIQFDLRLPMSLELRGGTGLYQQFPDFEQVLGAWASVDPRVERATQIDLGLERRFGSLTRAQVTVFDRQDHDLLRRADAEAHLAGTRVIRASSSARYANRLDGYARGVEILVQRKDANGLSGWLAYSYARNEYRDAISGEEYWGDLDQRHTLNACAAYRFSARTSVSGKLRVGSNFPAPGYFARAGAQYFIGSRRNDVRLPTYARLDLRANRTFTWSDRRLTLFAEVINVLDRDNVRYNPPSIDSRTGEARRLFQPMIPIVPSAGVLIEF